MRHPRITRPRYLTAYIATLTALLVCAAVAPSALAARGAVSFFGNRGTEGGQFPGGVGGVDINQAGTGGAAAGDVYVADTSGFRIQQFSASGEFIRAFGKDVGGAGVDICPTASACVVGDDSGTAGAVFPEGLAIDQSTGNVYVSDPTTERISVFSAMGSFEGAFGWNVKAVGGAEELQFCTALTGCKAGSRGSGAGQFAIKAEGLLHLSLAVRPGTGDVIVGDGINRRVSEFAVAKSGGKVTGVTFTRGYGWGAVNGQSEFQICTVLCHAPAPTEIGAEPGQFGSQAPYGVAVDASGQVYTTEDQSGFSGERLGKARVQVFSVAGSPLGDLPIGLATIHPNGGLAINRSGETIAFLDSSIGGIDEFDLSGTLKGEFLKKVVPLEAGFAYNESDGSLYVTFGNSKPNGVLIIGEAVPPEVSVGAATDVGGTTATFHGEVNPTGLSSNYHFEYSVDGAEWTSTQSAALPGDKATHVVEQQGTDLEAFTKYHLRLVAKKSFDGGQASAETSFETLAAPPVAGAVSAKAITDTRATLVGKVNPERQVTTYKFECVSEAKFKEGGYAEATDIPSGGATLEAAGKELEVSQQVTGLDSSTTYRCRLAASNPTGSVTGPETTFTTYAAQPFGLPDNRAYEQATPVDKNGNNVGGGLYLMKAAADGNASAYYITSGGSTEGGGQLFPSYSALRDGGSWVTSSFLPSNTFGNRARILGWSEDLRRDYVLVWESGQEATLYEHDLENGAMQTISGGFHRPGGGFYLGEGTAFAGESADGTAMLFESNVALTPEAAEGDQNLYLWDRNSESLVLVDLLPDDSPPHGGAFAGPWAWISGNAKSGGSAARSYTQDLHALSADGSTAFFTSYNVNQLYARIGLGTPGAQTVQVSASRKTNGSGSGGKDPKGPQKATFMEATSDGHYVFFTSPEKLTNDATTGPADQGNDLYRYDTGSGELIDIAPDEDDPNGAEVRATLGASTDGSYVYFAANGVLADGASAGGCNASPLSGNWSGGGTCNLYVWHDGEVTFVSPTNASSGGDALNWTAGNYSGNTLGMRTSRVSSGGTLLFSSVMPLTAYDSKGKSELYRYEPGAGLQCVSCNPTGAPADGGEASVQSLIPPTLHSLETTAFWVRNLSADGRRVFFDTKEQLVASDANGVNDVYEWEAKGAGSCQSEAQDGGCLYLISSGESDASSYFSDASADGNDVFFLTSQSLVRQDTDQLYDVYDARVDGGIPAQNQAPPTPCEGEACRAPGSATSQTQSAASATFSGPGNPHPNRKHKKKRHAKKHRKTHHKGGAASRHAKHANRARAGR